MRPAPSKRKIVAFDEMDILFKDGVGILLTKSKAIRTVRKGVKLLIGKDNIQLSVNSANSGEGNEKIKADFNSENLNISFNSKYLIDILAEIEDNNLKMNLKDSVSPVLIEDFSDKNSYYVIMPMKI